jgi:hypothetical protein
MSFRYGASMATVVFDKRYASTEMTNPNFAIAEGYYIKAKGNQKRRFRCCCRRNDGFKRFLFTRSYGREIMYSQ